MKKITILISAILISIFTFAQTKEEIINSKGKYYHGFGYGKDRNEAENNALNQLNQGISTTISSNTTFIATESSTGNKFDNESMYKSIVNSYSFIENLQNIRTFPPVHTKTGWEILKFVEKTEVEKVFEKREKLIKAMVSEAQNAKQNLKIGIALKNYYWAYILLQTYPNGTNLSTVDIPNIQTFIRSEIDYIFHDLDFVIKGQQQKDPKTIRYTMEVTYKQNPVSEMNYKVCLGTTCTNDVTVKNGIGFLDIDVNEKNSLQGNIPLHIEYKYISEMTNSDFTIRSLFQRDSKMINNLVENTNFRKSATSIYIENRIPEFDPQKNAVSSQKTTTNNLRSSDTVNDTEPDIYQKYLDVLSDVEKAIIKRDYSTIKNYFTEEGFKKFEKLTKYGKMSIMQKANYNFVEYQDAIMARSLQVAFHFNDNKNFVENIVFDFDKKTNLINAVTFALNDVDAEKIIKTDFYPEESRKAIINFIETYQTAYAMKDTEYLQKVFSEDALIVVGRLLQPAKYIDNIYIPAKIQQNIKSKKEFIDDFAKIAQKNQYINLDLNDVSVKKTGNTKRGETYGLQMKQNYTSSTYGDTGYLFIVVDLNDPSKPIIYVRTWQPERDYTVDEKTGLYDLTNIKTE